MPNLSCTLPAQGNWTTSHSLCARAQFEYCSEGISEEEEERERIQDTTGKRYEFIIFLQQMFRD